ncbi:hypothetical protein DVJ78_17635 [Humibacter sp. BT305]|nr:hypothetical protein DVJ78_17635 [Humibacter sp. BT305]
MTSLAPAPRRPDRTLRVTLLTIGSALVAGMLVLGGVQIARAAAGVDGEDTGVYAVAADVTALKVDSSASSVSIAYGDVDLPTLDFDSGGSSVRLTQQVSGQTLLVKVGGDGWWSFGFLGGLQDASLDITLPRDSAPIALDVDSSAGAVDAAGDFAAVDLSSSAGSVTVSGSADSLRLHSSAGRVTGTDLDVPGEVRVDSSAGSAILSFASLPSSMEVESSAGSVRVAIPDGDYEIRADTSVGSVDVSVPNRPGASRVYSFESSAGSVTVEPAR